MAGPRQTVPYNVTLLSVQCVAARTAVVLGARDTVLRTTDGGASWTHQPVPSLGLDLSDASFVSATTTGESLLLPTPISRCV